MANISKFILKLFNVDKKLKVNKDFVFEALKDDKMTPTKFLKELPKYLNGPKSVSGVDIAKLFFSEKASKDNYVKKFLRNNFTASQIEKIKDEKTLNTMLNSEFRKRVRQFENQIKKKANQIEKVSDNFFTFLADVRLPTIEQYKTFTTRQKMNLLQQLNNERDKIKNKIKFGENFSKNIVRKMTTIETSTLVPVGYQGDRLQDILAEKKLVNKQQKKLETYLKNKLSDDIFFTTEQDIKKGYNKSLKPRIKQTRKQKIKAYNKNKKNKVKKKVVAGVKITLRQFEKRKNFAVSVVKKVKKYNKKKGRKK